jgi:hypothetical protein
MATKKFIILTALLLLLSGLAANKVCACSNGRMPVLAEDISPDPNHTSYCSDTRYPYLCDWIEFQGYAYSLGDILMLSSVVVPVIILWRSL